MPARGERVRFGHNSSYFPGPTDIGGPAQACSWVSCRVWHLRGCAAGTLRLCARFTVGERSQNRAHWSAAWMEAKLNEPQATGRAGSELQCRTPEAYDVVNRSHLGLHFSLI